MLPVLTYEWINSIITLFIDKALDILKHVNHDRPQFQSETSRQFFLLHLSNTF